MKTLLLLCLFLVGCGGGGVGPVTEPVAVTVVRSNIVFIGDSITSRWDLSRYFENAINLGVGGDTSAMMLARFGDVLAANPKTVVIEAGTNDMPDPKGIGSVEAMASIASSAGAKVILLNLMSRNERPPDDVAELRRQILLFNAALLPLCARYACVDNYSISTLPDGSLGPLMTVDFIHPNDLLYGLMADKLRPFL